ncbi:unnamed protein product [Rhodiola kirilowii]
MRRRLHFLTIRNISSETKELVIGKASEETKNHPRTEMKMVQYHPLDIPHSLNINKCRDEDPSLMIMGITTTAHPLWENSMPQISKRSRGAFARALN